MNQHGIQHFRGRDTQLKIRGDKFEDLNTLADGLEDDLTEDDEIDTSFIDDVGDQTSNFQLMGRP